MKVIIEDIVKEMATGELNELPEGTRIRFVTNAGKFSVYIEGNGIRIDKVGTPDDQITIKPSVCNSLNIS